MRTRLLGTALAAFLALLPVGRAGAEEVDDLPDIVLSHDGFESYEDVRYGKGDEFIVATILAVRDSGATFASPPRVRIRVHETLRGAVRRGVHEIEWMAPELYMPCAVGEGENIRRRNATPLKGPAVGRRMILAGRGGTSGLWGAKVWVRLAATDSTRAQVIRDLERWKPKYDAQMAWEKVEGPRQEAKRRRDAAAAAALERERAAEAARVDERLQADERARFAVERAFRRGADVVRLVRTSEAIVVARVTRVERRGPPWSTLELVPEQWLVRSASEPRLASSSSPVIAVSIDPALDRRVVSPLVYGVNYGSSTEFTAVPYPLRRWGGNSTSRYSWTLDTHNSGADWYFISTPGSNDPAQLPNGSAADDFVAESRARGAEVIVTVPTIGWVPKDRVKRWGFSVAKYGAQQGTECTGSGGAWWCAADAGNSVRTNGTPITGNDPLDTSVAVGPSYVGDWIDHLAGRFGDAASGGVRYYALDNEPALWNSTHRDVHPSPLTYDELWAKTLAYGAEVKARDPAAQVLGPVSWGWCEYFHSAADGCTPGADQAAHGGMPLLEWWLAQVRAHELGTSTRVADVLDVHYYPQSGGALNDDESAAAAAKRLRSVKSLYDPAYVDESWIGQPVRLLPRLRDMIAARAPGLGIAITEYNFGGDTGISSALAQAEALAVFGREGVALATRWVAPANGSRVQDAFRLYLDYDGAGSLVDGTSVRTTTAKIDSVGAYAIEGADGRVFVLLFNKHTAGETVALALAGGGDRAVSLFRFTAAAALGPAGASALAAGTLSLALPARSATLAVVAPATTAVDGPAAGADAAFALRAAPNPARGETVLSFTLPRSAAVDLAVFDLAGRRVRALAPGTLDTGPHRLRWDGRDGRGRAVPGGVYLARLRALGATASVRLLRLP